MTEQILLLMGFCALMVGINYACGRATHWTSWVMKLASYILLCLGLIALVWQMVEVIL